MKPTDYGRLSRRAALMGLAGGLVAAGMGGQALAAPLPELIDGEYVPEALQEISGILRDWRADLVKPYHERALDVLAAAHARLDVDEPFEVVSGYRSPQTNAAMRQRSSGVARNSYHTRAMAVDVKLKNRSVRQIAGAADPEATLGIRGDATF